MEKSGIVITDQGDQFNIFWFKRDDKEVIAVIDNVEDFKFLQLDTYEAFYSNIKYRERVYNVDLINSILRTLLITEDTEEIQDISLTDKGEVLLSIKYIGLKSKRLKREIVFKDGSIIRENYFDKFEIKLSIVDEKATTPRFTPFGVFDKDTVIINSGMVTNRPLTAKELKKIYDLEHLAKYDHRCVHSIVEAEELLRIFKNSPYKKRSVDFETTGLKNRYGGKDKITGIVLGVDNKTAFYFPFRQDKFAYNLPLEWIQYIVDAVNGLPRDVLVYAHYSKMELKQIKNELNKRLRVDRDTFILSLLADPGFSKGVHGLKDRIYQITGDYFLSLDDIYIGCEIEFNNMPEDVVMLYALADGTNTLIISDYLEKLILSDSPRGQDIIELESKMLWLKMKQEYWGLRFDMKKLNERINQTEYILEQLEHAIKKIYKMEGSVNSSNYKRRLFYEVLNLPVEKVTETGLAAIDAKTLKFIRINNSIKEEKDYLTEINGVTLEPILDNKGEVVLSKADLGSCKYPAAVLYLKHAKVKKLLGDYNKLIKKSYEDIFEFTIYQNAAKSGRQTSDAHQFSHELKDLILADSDEHEIISIDYAQIELRVMAGIFGVIPLLELMKNHSDDVHRAFTKLLTGKDIWEISDKERSDNKSVSFGVVYLMAARSMANKAVEKEGRLATEEEVAAAQAKIDKLFEVLPQMARGIGKTVAGLKETGKVIDMFGRCGKYPILLDPLASDAKKSSAIRSGNNMTVQGPAASIMKMGEINCDEYIISKGWDEEINVNGRVVPLVRVIVPIHDELLISKHKSVDFMDVTRMLKDCMEFDKIPGFPTFYCTPGIGDNWGMAKEPKYEMPIDLRDRALKYYELEGKHLIDFTNSDTYLHSINEFRKAEILEYMESIYREGMSTEELASKIRHPAYTHMLIAAYAGDTKNISHMQCIYNAADNYLKERNGGEFKMPEFADSHLLRSNDDDESEELDFIENGKGELIEVIDVTQDSSSYLWMEEDIDSRHFAGKVESDLYYLIFGSQVILDLTKINLTGCNNIYDYIDKMMLDMNHTNEGKHDYGLGVVVDMAALNIITTDYMINYKQIEEIVNYIKKGELVV